MVIWTNKNERTFGFFFPQKPLKDKHFFGEIIGKELMGFIRGYFTDSYNFLRTMIMRFLITMAIYIFNCHLFGVISNKHPTLISLAFFILAIYHQNVNFWKKWFWRFSFIRSGGEKRVKIVRFTYVIFIVEPNI